MNAARLPPPQPSTRIELALDTGARYSSRVRRRLRIIVVATGVLVVLVTASALATLPYARQRMRSEIEARCAAAVGGHCNVGNIELARDGAVATQVRARNAATGATAEVARVAIALRWWPFLMGREQGVTVRASGVTFSSDASLDELFAEVRRIQSRRAERWRARRGHGRVRIDRLLVERVSARSRLQLIFHGQLDDASLDWTRGGPVLARWAEATVESGPLTAGRTGRCTLRRDAGAPQAVLDCEHFSTRLDVQSVGERGAIVRQIFRTWMGGLDLGARAPRQANPPRIEVQNEDELGPFDGLGTLVMRAREGSITLTRGDEEFLRLEPAGITIEISGGRLRSALLRVGGDERGGPSIDAELTPGSSWRLDVRADGVPLRDLAHWVPAVPWHDTGEGRARARVRIEPGERRGELVIEGEAALERFGLQHPGLSHDPIDGLDAMVRGAAQIDLRRHRVSTEGITATLNGVTVALAGWAEHSERRTALDVALRVPTTSCDAIRRSLPAVVTGPVNDLTFAGRVGADLRLALDTANLAATALEVHVDDQCAIAHDGLRQGVRRLGGPFVQRVEEPGGLRAFVTGPGSAAWVPFAEISPHVVNAVLVREDGGFYRHHGFNLNEIRGAIVRDVSARRFAYGASTITMQLAKNIFLRREKTLVRKLQEVVLTWYLERSLDKDAILEMYLNVVEFGPGIYGIGPASRFFFGREPRDLRPLEAIYLATLLPNPTARFATYQRGVVSHGTLALLRGVARVMGLRGQLSPEEVETAMSDTVAFRSPNAPVPGALTQNVPPDTTDEQAEAMSPGNHYDDDIAGDEGGQGASPGAESEDDTGERVGPSSVVPVSLRTGGRI